MTATYSPSFRLHPGTSGPTTGTKAAGKSAGLPWPVYVYLFCIIVPLTFSAGPLSMNTLRLFLVIVIVPLTIRLFTGKYGRLFLTDFLFVAHLAWATLALAINSPDQVVTQFGSVGAEFLGGYVIGRAYIRTQEQFIALCKVLAVIVLCLLPFALYETVTGRPIILETLRRLPGVSSLGTVHYEARMGFERVQTVFSHPIHHGLFASVTFSLSFVALRGISSDAWRWTSSILIGLCGFLALSSGALLAVFLQIALILWATIFAGFRRRWWLLLGLFALAWVTVDILSNRSPLRVFMSYATFSAHNAYIRSIIFEWGMVNVWSSPIFGLGLRDWVRASYLGPSIDNFWLVMTMRYGIPSFLLLALGYVHAVHLIMRRNFDGDGRLTLIRRAWVFTFLGLSFTLATVHIWTHIYSFVFFMFAAGMWLIAVPAGGAAAEAPALDQTAERRRGRGTGRSNQPGRGSQSGRTPTAARLPEGARDPEAPATEGEPADPAALRRQQRYSRFPQAGQRLPRLPDA